MQTIRIRLARPLLSRLDELVERRRTARSRLIREAIETYCADLRRPRPVDRIGLLRQLVDYPGSGRGDLAEHDEAYLRASCQRKRSRRRRR